MNKSKILILVKILIIICAIVFSSCSKQTAGQLSDTIYTGEQELKRLEACTNVSFVQNVLYHQNMIWVFECLKWDREFPALFRSLKNISNQTWNHIFAPLDKEFLGNYKRKERFFKQIKQLDTKESLDDLGKVIIALNDTNFFDSMNMMFHCIEDNNSENCKRDSSNIPTKEELLKAFEILELNPEIVLMLANVIKKISDNVEPNQEQLRIEIRKFKDLDLFYGSRIWFLDGVANRILGGLIKNDREIIVKLLSSKNKKTGEPWLKTWIKNFGESSEKFVDLLKYPYKTNPYLIQEVEAIKFFYEKGLICRFKDDKKTNEEIDFNFVDHLSVYMDLILNEGSKSFMDFTANSIVGMQFSLGFCNELNENEYNVNLPETLFKISKLLQEEQYFNLVRFGLKVSENGQMVTGNFRDDQYLMDLITSDEFKNLNIINGVILDNAEKFYPILFEILKEIDNETYYEIASILNELFKAENEKILYSLAKVWNFYNLEEKNFLFNFVDRHFDVDTRFVELFKFYSSLLLEFPDISPTLALEWIGDNSKKEQTFQSLKELATYLDGKEVQQDFKKFFTRDHILTVLEILSSGIEINKYAKTELEYRDSSDYISRKIIKSHQIEFNNKFSKSNEKFFECLDRLSKKDSDLYYLINYYPFECTELADDHISLTLFGWINFIELDFKKKNNKPLLDDLGILSPQSLSSSLSILKFLDNNLILNENSNVKKIKISDTLDIIKVHLFDKGLIEIIKNAGLLIKDLNDRFNDETRVWINSIIKDFSNNKTFNNSTYYFTSVEKILLSYSQWVKDNSLEKYKISRSDKISYKKEFSCESVMNSKIYAQSCPDKETVKKHLKNIFTLMTNVYEKPQKSAIHHLIKSTAVGHGVKIPYRNSAGKNYRVTLGETFEYLYNTTDRNLKINNMDTYYIDSKWKGHTISMSTLERVEVVIRDVRFRNNFLGASFLNGIVSAPSYNEEVEKRYKLMKNCLKIPKLKCMRSLTKDEERQADNAVRAFYSLLDVNNGRGLYKGFSYGNYLRAFETTLVASSAYEAQEVKTLPLKDELLIKHNGRILGEMTMINLWSNVGRIVRDRLGRTREEFELFMNTDMKRIDDAFLRGFDIDKTGDATRRIIKFIITEDQNKNTPLNQIVDWAASLNYEETRIAEEVMGRMLLASTYLGHPSSVFKSSSSNDEYDSFKDNNLYELFINSERLIKYFQSFIKFYPGDKKFIDALDTINNLLIFVNEELRKTNNPDENFMYKFINGSFDIIQNIFLKKHIDVKFSGSLSESVSGIEILDRFLSDDSNLSKIYGVSLDSYNYLISYSKDNGDGLKSLAINLNHLINSKQIKFGFLRDYLEFTTKSEICLGSIDNCSTNNHYDEIRTLINYSMLDDLGQIPLEKGLKNVFVEKIDQLKKLFSDLLPAIKLRTVNYDVLKAD